MLPLRNNTQVTTLRYLITSPRLLSFLRTIRRDILLLLVGMGLPPMQVGTRADTHELPGGNSTVRLPEKPQTRKTWQEPPKGALEVTLPVPKPNLERQSPQRLQTLFPRYLPQSRYHL